MQASDMASEAHRPSRHPQKTRHKHAAVQDYTLGVPFGIIVAMSGLVGLAFGAGLWAILIGVLGTLVYTLGSMTAMESHAGKHPQKWKTAAMSAISGCLSWVYYKWAIRDVPGAGLVTALCVASSFMCLYMCYIVVAGGSRPQPKAGKVSPAVSGSSRDPLATQDADGWGSRASARDEGVPRSSHHKSHAQHQPQPDHSLAQPASTGMRSEPAMATTTMAEGDQAAMEQVINAAVAQGLENQLQGAVENVLTDPNTNLKLGLQANINTLLAVTGVILFWRGIWTMCDTFLGSSLPLDLASVLIGLSIMALIKFLKLPLAESLPGT